MSGNLIALFGFQETSAGGGLTLEKHYRLAPPAEVTQEDLIVYQLQSQR